MNYKINERCWLVKKLKFLLGAMIAVVVSGCASMNKEDCQGADWYLMGLKDGEKGKLVSKVADYQKQCGEFGVSPDLPQYNLGRDKGLLTYCTKDTGFNEGRRNSEYKGVCAAELQVIFMSGYVVGQKYYAVIDEINEFESTINKHNRKIKKNNQAIKNMKDMVRKSDNPAKTRQKLIGEVLAKNNDSVRLQTEIGFARQQLAVKKYQLEQLRSEYGYQ